MKTQSPATPSPTTQPTPNQVSGPGTNLHKRLPVAALASLAEFFKDNPHQYSPGWISEKAGVRIRTVRVLLLIWDRRPDLVKQVLADELSLYKAGELMRADPSKWRKQTRTRL